MAQDRPTRRGAITPTPDNSPAALSGFGKNYAQRAIEATFFGDPLDDIQPAPPSGSSGGAALPLKSTRLNAAGATQIDWSNPITAGLFFAAIGPDVIHGADPSALDVSTSVAVTEDGYALRTDSFGTHRRSLSAPVTSDSWTLFARASMPDNNAYQVLFGITDAVNNDRIHLHSVIFPLREFGVDARPYKSDHAADASYLFPRPSRMTSCGVVINTPENNIRLFCDGEVRRFDVLNEGRAATYSQYQYFAKNDTSDVAVATTSVSVALCFTRALTLDEMASLQNNPWQVFR